MTPLAEYFESLDSNIKMFLSARMAQGQAVDEICLYILNTMMPLVIEENSDLREMIEVHIASVLSFFSAGFAIGKKSS